MTVPPINLIAINDPTTEIAKHRKRWARNRALIAGEDEVKQAGVLYLPRLPSQRPADYEGYLASVDFFPAARRTHDATLGLIFRKPPTMVGGDNYADVFETVSDARSLDQLAKFVTSETLITNFTGIFVDSPLQPQGISRAEAEAGGYRPRQAIYTAENILEVTSTVIANRRKISRVRLLEDDGDVRELLLLEGIYTVNIWRETEQGWIIVESFVPRKAGAPQTEIPFRIVSDIPGSTVPCRAALDDVCLLNLSHYRAQAQWNNVLRNIASPLRWITGLEDLENAYVVSPDQIWQFTSADTKIGMLEHSGAGVAALEIRCQHLADQMAAVGARILQSEKAAAEAAETLAIRKAAEGSIMAATASNVGKQIEASVNFMLELMGAQPITYTLNTDYLPTPMSAQEIAALLAVVQAGQMSSETFFEALKLGEVLNDGLTYDEERDRIDRDRAEAPPIDAAQFDGVGGLES
ncbi:hypothetical protein ASE85_03310 [Sphingobium sp. Leaf26]|uniref:DUF4055 domain-containing protein n=1 Tax=Sphingobium sp. Leaf26 TaxID=1735693 RepID=UPI0006FADAEB|nr:DUF4055 domain-containing protein [Sphingobium sp. Leaf26]KQN09972.1 hypothetical protein ASE85_03310 [Sphingobium sp. Leaf26]